MNDPQTHQLLGQLRGQMEAIQRQLTDSEAKASESREKVYESLDEIRTDAQDTRARTEALEAVVREEVRPVVRLVRDWRSRALGGMAVLGVIGAFILLILGAAREAIIEIGRAIFMR